MHFYFGIEELIKEGSFFYATEVHYGEYVMVDYLNGGDLPDGMKSRGDERGVYICRCLSPKIKSMSFDYREGRVQPVYNMTTHKAAKTGAAIYLESNTRTKSLCTASGAIAYQNTFGYDDASVKTLIDAAEAREKEEARKKM